MKDENRKWFLVTMVVLATLMAWILGKFFTFLGVYFNVTYFLEGLVAKAGWNIKLNPLFGIFPLYYTISVISNFLLVIYLIKRQDVALFAGETIQELKKVTWPTYSDTAKSTGVVLVVVFIFALILWLYDSILTKVLSYLLG